MAKGWTEERRRKQAERIRQTKPWEKSTGPKTPMGKRRSSLNALKTGKHTREGKLYVTSLAAVCRLNAAFLIAYKQAAVAQWSLERLQNELNKRNGKAKT